jgi:RNA polymerase sigma-70 factor (ECF subfamily)
MELDKIQKVFRGTRREKKLFSKVKKKDKEAFVEAYDLYIDQIFRFVYFKVGDKEEASDLTSAVFLKTWNYIQDNSVENIKTLRALIYKIARTTIIDYYRKNSNFNKVTIDGEDEDRIDIKDEKQDIARQAEINSDFGLLEKKMKDLKDEYREVIVLRFIDELSIKEISSVIGKPKNNVRVLIHRALKALRELADDIK